MQDAVAFYQSNLLHHPAGKAALAYLHQRGLTDQTISDFELGYAPDSWNAITEHLLSKGYNRQQLVDTGMISEKRDEKGDVIKDGNFYDRFRNRIMIPIHDSSGNTIAFGARILDPNDVPKFLNSPQTLLFDKGRTLFGLDRARVAIREKNQAVIVEGYMDVIMLHQAGFTNTVAPMGTALGAYQVKLLTRQSRNIVLALDADAAGNSATLKGIDTLRTTALDEPDEAGVLESKSLIIHETKMKADIRITRIPEGMDPDEVVLRDPAEWQKILENAQPVVVYMMETLAKGRDLDDAKTKSEIAAQVMPLIREVTDLIERETYRQQLARFLRIDEALLKYNAFQKPPQKGRPVRRSDIPEKPGLQKQSLQLIDPKSGIHNKEITILQILYHYYSTPGSISKIDRNFRRYNLNPLRKEDFEGVDLREIAACYFDGLNQDDELNTQIYILERIPASFQEMFEKIKSPLFQGVINDLELDTELTRSVALLRMEKNNFSQTEIQMILQDQGKTGNEINDLTEILDQLIRERKNLEKLLQGLESVF